MRILHQFSDQFQSPSESFRAHPSTNKTISLEMTSSKFVWQSRPPSAQFFKYNVCKTSRNVPPSLYHVWNAKWRRKVIYIMLFQWKQRWGVVTKLSPAAGEWNNVKYILYHIFNATSTICGDGICSLLFALEFSSYPFVLWYKSCSVLFLVSVTRRKVVRVDVWF